MGLTLETRPDHAKLKNCDRMLSLGCTRVELGIQSTYDSVLKKIKRGHEVDLSDIINVAMIFNKAEGQSTEEWNNTWQAFEEATNTRSKRITSNIISLCRYAYAIANYLEKVGQALIKYHDNIFDKSQHSWM